MLFANPELINYLNKMKAPYNISAPNQELALAILENEKGMKQRIQSILNERTRVLEALEEMESVLKIYPSDANFILILVEDANTMYDELQSRGVIIRNRNSVVKNALRISIGAPQENDILLKSLKEISDAKSIVCR
jgi:histidinol-phosphate aminotransferase